MDVKPLVSFIICTYNRAGYLDDTLQSLLQTDYASPYEFLVVDNNSTDNTHEVVEAYQNNIHLQGATLRYVKEHSRGLSHARNRAIKEARADHLVFFDDDIIATPTLIPAWCSFFEEHPIAVAAGGKIHVQFDAPRPEWMPHFLLPLLGHHDLGNKQRKYPANKYPFGGNMGFRKSVFDETGLFNTDLGRKGKELNAAEEKELFQRIREHSGTIMYLPEAFLYHRVDSGRLTIDFIRGQALGLGQSMKLRMQNVSLLGWIKNWGAELAKLLATFPIGMGYLLLLQRTKAKLLFQFRFWIWQGYLERD